MGLIYYQSGTNQYESFRDYLKMNKSKDIELTLILNK